MSIDKNGNFVRRSQGSPIWASCRVDLLQSSHHQPAHNPILDEIRAAEAAKIREQMGLPPLAPEAPVVQEAIPAEQVAKPSSMLEQLLQDKTNVPYQRGK